MAAEVRVKPQPHGEQSEDAKRDDAIMLDEIHCCGDLHAGNPSIQGSGYAGYPG